MSFIKLLLPLLFAVLLAAQQPVSGSGWRVQGERAYKAGEYAEAAQDFERAVSEDPDSLPARLDLARDYMVQWVPGLATPENQQYLAQARHNFQLLLQSDPANKQALTSLADLKYEESAVSTDPVSKANNLSEAHDLFRKLSQVDPSGKEAFYMEGVIAWSGEFPAVQRARGQSGTAGNIDLELRRHLRKEYGASIEEGLDDLRMAIQIDPGYADAMAYMNLLLRDRAAIRDTSAEADQDLAEAQNWTNKSLEARRLQTGQAPAPDTVVRPAVVGPPLPAAAKPGKEIAIGGRVAESNLIRKVQPSYPPEAKAASVQGMVEFAAHIGTDGKINSLDLVRGHPLLVNAAREAVLQWEYRPVLLNGSPVAVVTKVIVNFTLSP